MKRKRELTEGLDNHMTKKKTHRLDKLQGVVASMTAGMQEAFKNPLGCEYMMPGIAWGDMQETWSRCLKLLDSECPLSNEECVQALSPLTVLCNVQKNASVPGTLFDLVPFLGFLNCCLTPP